MANGKLRVAITGGGVAGASLMHALIKNGTNIDAHIFESAPSFREAGIAIGVTRNAQLALSMIGPSATQCLKDAGGVIQTGVCFSVEQGKDVGHVIYERDAASEGKALTTIVQRANLLREFFRAVPEERMHASKRLLSADTDRGSVVLTFEDGTTHECDILIGADGIHSRVRRMVLGEDDVAANARNSGSWAIMTLNPYEKARSCLEKVDISDAREYGGTGENGFMMYNILSGGTLVQFALCGWEQEEEKSPEWRRMISNDELRARYVGSGWAPHLAGAVDQLLCQDADKTEHQAIYLWHHLPAHTYAKGPLCITGDAAHATTPFQASGAGMSIEDSAILSNLLSRAANQREAIAALEAYDQVRRQRTQRIVESSWQTGKMLLGVHPDTQQDAARLTKALRSRWDFIVDVDLEADLAQGIKTMQQSLGGA